MDCVLKQEDEEEDQAMQEFSSTPRPMEGLQEAGLAPFLKKTYDMVEDPATDGLVSWGTGRSSFVVWDSHRFAAELLPCFFKHSNFFSFVRQLNTYGFRKIDPHRWEFANRGFLGGQRHLLKNITRRRPASQNEDQPGREGCFEVAKSAYDGGIDRLKMECNKLMWEVMKLRQEQQISRTRMLAMEDRVHGTERKQQHMMAFLARAIGDPIFICNLLEHLEKGRGIEGSSKRKRVNPSGLIGEDVGAQIVNYNGQADEESDLSRGIEAFFLELQNESYPSSCCESRGNELHKETGSCSSQGCENQLPSSENTDSGFRALDDDNDVWEQILNDELVVSCGGNKPVETHVNPEDLVAVSSSWGNELKVGADQVGFMESRF